MEAEFSALMRNRKCNKNLFQNHIYFQIESISKLLSARE
jgi:hypothetical protein